MQQMIKFEEFSAYYKVRGELIKALDNVTFSVAKGEFVVLLGESGSGKSTLIKSVMGLTDFIEGDLTVGGTGIDYLNVKKLNCAYVSQEISLYPHLTVFDNIAFPLKMTKTPVEEIECKVLEIAKKLKISWLLTRKIKQLSGGQQQRVAIARSLVKDPQILLLDEPFANIDHTFRKELCALIKQIHETDKQTVIFVTHDIPEALMLAERIIVLENGRVAEDGRPEELVANPQSDLLKAYREMKKINV